MTTSTFGRSQKRGYSRDLAVRAGCSCTWRGPSFVERFDRDCPVAEAHVSWPWQPDTQLTFDTQEPACSPPS